MTDTKLDRIGVRALILTTLILTGFAIVLGLVMIDLGAITTVVLTIPTAFVFGAAITATFNPRYTYPTWFVVALVTASAALFTAAILLVVGIL